VLLDLACYGASQQLGQPPAPFPIMYCRMVPELGTSGWRADVELEIAER